jgi:rubrerythrin
MHDMTAANLRSAYGGESMAHLRYKVWGEKASRDGFPNVARLFQAISRAEESHGTNHFKALAKEEGAFLAASMGGFGFGTTSENLQGAIDGETFEVTEMYPAYRETAESQDEKHALQSFDWALSAEKIHAAMFQKAKDAVDAGRDPALGPLRICMNCGHTVEGDIPDKCPICKVSGKRYVTFA